jgi:GNAT superfamily N-acetyltransferase
MIASFARRPCCEQRVRNPCSPVQISPGLPVHAGAEPLTTPLSRPVQGRPAAIARGLHALDPVRRNLRIKRLDDLTLTPLAFRRMEPAVFAIRPVLLADYDDLRPLIDPHDPEPKARRLFAQLVDDDSWAIIGAYRDERVVGYVAVQDYGPHLRHGDFHRTIRMHDLIVTESVRGHGAGTQLLNAAIEWARGRGRYVEWQAHETRAAPFYTKLGYTGVACPQPDYPTFTVDLHPEQR